MNWEDVLKKERPQDEWHQQVSGGYAVPNSFAEHWVEYESGEKEILVDDSNWANENHGEVVDAEMDSELDRFHEVTLRFIEEDIMEGKKIKRTGINIYYYSQKYPTRNLPYARRPKKISDSRTWDMNQLLAEFGSRSDLDFAIKWGNASEEEKEEMRSRGDD